MDMHQLMDELAALKEKVSSYEAKLETKAPATTQTAVPLHGPGGMFANCGLEREIITAHVRPFGLANRLPALPSVNVDPRFGSITGFSDVTGAEPTNACEDAPSGYMKGCNLTARFGMIRRDTETIEMDKVMLKMNRGEHTDLVLRGRLLGLTDLIPSGLDENAALEVLTMAEMVGVGVQTERKLNKQLWQGVTTITNEFPGLDVQIATGQRDADTGTLCPALDSDVKNYGCRLLAADIVNYLSQLEWYLRYNAMTMGLEPVTWVVVMRPELWFELTALWPCSYHTVKCSPYVDTNSTVFIDGRDNTAERDAMRNGMYININGNRYEVIVDTGIYEQNSTNTAGFAAGEFASNIYMVPLTIAGGMPVTYREYVDYRAADRDTRLLRGLETYFWTDRGMFSWFVDSEKWCYKLGLKTEQRVVLRAPHLAGRIDCVKYSPLQHLRDSDPASPYWQDGGVSLRGGLTDPYAVWSTRQ